MHVPPHGPREARYAIVGEAPGAQEARQGRPFCGPSGELLQSTLKKVGLDPDEVYITNVYPEYRPGNPTPTPEEINDRLEGLAEELAELPNLKHVLAVGNVPMRALTGRNGGITKTQGQLLEPRKVMVDALKDKDIMPIMHPAYVLRNNNYQTQNLFQEILGSFVALGKKHRPENVVLLRSDLKATEDFWRAAETATRAAIDIEATPVPWWHEDFWVISVAISFDGETAYVIDTRESIKVVRKLRDQHPGIKWVMHNGSYDRQALLSLGIDLDLVFDTMTAQYLIDPDSRKSLQYMSSMYLGLAPYKDVDYKNILEEPWEKVAQMNGVDAIRTFRLYEHLKPKLLADQRLARLMRYLMLPAINALLEMELAGMPIDTERLQSVTEKYEADAVRQADALRELARKNGMDKFNPRSNKDKQELIFNRLGFQPVGYTKSGNPSLDAASRKSMKLKPQNMVTGAIDLLDEYSVSSQRLGTFLYPWAEMERDGRLHTKYKPNHVVSGRLSSEKPNMQQVPNDPDIRSIMGGVPGQKLIMLDYSQLELRLAAEFADETAMLDAYRREEDLHAITAERVLGDAKSGRQVGKILNFSLLYGAGWATFQNIAWTQYGVRISDEEAQSLHRGFFKAYPALRNWHQVQINKARSLGYVESPLGRRRYLPNIENWQDGAARSHDEKVAINHPIQSLGSDLMLLSLTEMWKRGLNVVATVHDSVILIANEVYAEQVGEEAREIMENIINEVEGIWGTKIRVPLVADLHIDTHWSKG